MSVSIARRFLTEQEKLEINSELTVLIDRGSRKHQKVELIQCYYSTALCVNVPLYFAVNTLNCSNDDIVYHRPVIEFTGQLREYQQDLIAEALEKLAQQRSFNLIASPGAGKTVIGVYLAAKLACVTCILIDRKTLIEQWIKTITTFTETASYWIVGEKGLDLNTLPDFLICMSRRVTKIPDELKRQVSLLIVDEAHKFCTKLNFSNLMQFQPIYAIAMTATPKLEHGGYELIHKLAGSNYVSYSTNKTIQVYTLFTDYHWSRVINPKTDELDWVTIDKELHYHPERNSLLLSLIAANLDRKIMVFSGRTKHVDMLYEALCYYKINCDYMSGSKKTYNDSNVLIGTTSKVGTGFDEATFCPDFDGNYIDTVIIFNSYRSLVQLEQNIGRSRASFPTIYHFVDKDSIISNHWSQLKKFYLDTNSPVKAEIQKVNIEVKLVWPFNEDGKWTLN